MPELPSHSNESSPDERGMRRGIRYDAIAVVISSLVGLLALVVGGYTAYIQRQQVRAQVWPYLIGGNSGHGTELIWVNKGVGPAIVHGVQVTIAGKPQRDWNTILASVGLVSAPYHQTFLNGNVVSPGETIHWMQFSDSRDYASFMRFARRPDFRIHICYCSTLGDCWRTGFGGTERQAVGKCPAVPETEQFRD